ncbi:MAG: N-acetylmuramoyl-L-alanine amidase [Hyphomonadaceae bacterium]|nr:N-acetylmuramoyl-L-alanine amidase [Hyphomonadaceae bacterium]
MRIVERPSPNYEARESPVAFVVLHYTGMQDAETALARLCDPEPMAGRYPGPWQDPALDPETRLGRASSHYCVAEDGTIYRLVPEDKRAWHAGLSSWKGKVGLNDCSVGIEIVNGGHDFGLPDFPEVQIKTVIDLVREILARHKLTASDVVGHSDIAPERKYDPGEKFPWRRLAEEGVSVWPRAASFEGLETLSPGQTGEAVAALQRDLAAFGYGLPQTGVYDPMTQTVVDSFQRRFRPERIDGIADGKTRALLHALLR